MRDLINRFIQRIENFNATQEEDALLVALDKTAQLKSRIQQSGIDADGNQFEDYSPAYKKVRVKKGLQVGIVDYTDSNEFFGSVGPRVVSNDDKGKVSVVIGTNKPAMVKRLRGWLSSRGDDVIKNSQEEIRQAYIGYYQRRLNRFFGNN